LQDDRTPLHFASRDGHLEVVRYLIEKCGAGANVKDAVSEFYQLIDWIDLCSSLALFEFQHHFVLEIR
jgi:ankyrin repeat protein